MRKCNQCDYEIKGSQAEELAGMSNHLIQHNPTPKQWSEAYELIQRGREKSKRVSE